VPDVAVAVEARRASRGRKAAVNMIKMLLCNGRRLQAWENEGVRSELFEGQFAQYTRIRSKGTFMYGSWVL
jgi:hypothetical protein